MNLARPTAVLLVALLCCGPRLAAAQTTPPAGAVPDTTAAPVPPAAPVPAPAPTPAPAQPTVPPVQTTAPPPAPAATTPAQPAPAAAPQSGESKVYYGGTVSLSFGDVFVIGLHPMIAYKLTPKLSAGVEVSYEYVNYDVPDESAHNYGGSVFSRFRLLPQIYAHAEYQVINYEVFKLAGGSSREAVPFLWLGGGFSQPIGPRTWAYVEVLFDVLQDDNSPYSDWEPLYSFGVSVGF